MAGCRHKMTLFLVLIAVAAALASCAEPTTSSQTCDLEVPPGTYVGLAGDSESASTTYCFEVSESADPIKIRLVYRVTNGSVAWSLRGPDGTERWNGQISDFESGESSIGMRAVAGTWLLHVVASDLAGGYHLIWGEEQ